jgi:hypothetical protein
MAISLTQHRAGITQTAIAKFSDRSKPKSGLLSFFKSTTTTAKQVSIEVRRNGRKISVDVQRCTDPVRNIFSKSSEKIFVPPFHSESFDFTACEAYNRTFGSGNTPSKYDATSMVSDAAENLMAIEDKITRAKIKQVADVLQTGIVTIKNGDSIDFKRKAASMKVLSGGAKWDATSTADPLQDYYDGAEFLRTQGLSSGTAINAIHGTAAMSNLLANPKVQALLDLRNIKRGDIGMPQFDGVTGLVFHGQIAAKDYVINLWTFVDSYEDASGNDVKYIATNNVIMLPDDFEGQLVHAGVPAVVKDSEGNALIVPKAGEIVVHDVVDQVKRTWELLAESAPLAIPVSIDRIYTIQTA